MWSSHQIYASSNFGWSDSLNQTPSLVLVAREISNHRNDRVLVPTGPKCLRELLARASILHLMRVVSC
jgi:hypothetical protein